MKHRLAFLSLLLCVLVGRNALAQVKSTEVVNIILSLLEFFLDF